MPKSTNWSPDLLAKLLGKSVQLTILDDGNVGGTLYGTLHRLDLAEGYAVQERPGEDLLCFGWEHVDQIATPSIEGALPEIVVRRPSRIEEKPPLELLVRQLLVAIGEDPTREGLVDTPRRVAKFWREFIDFDPGNHETTFEAVQVDEMIIVPKIAGWSLCEHHLLPFSFEAHVGYITGERVVGLSKIPRIVRKVAHRLQLQERLTNDIADELERIVKPKGVAVVVRGQHTCMQMRGVEAREAEMVTSCMRGVFLGNPVARQEFMSLIGG